MCSLDKAQLDIGLLTNREADLKNLSVVCEGKEIEKCLFSLGGDAQSLNNVDSIYYIVNNPSLDEIILHWSLKRLSR